MALQDEVMRAALEEYIAFGPQTARPAADRLANRLPGASAEDRQAALEVAREAVDAAFALAREHHDGARTHDSVGPELARRFPWLRSGVAAGRRAWWRPLQFWVADPPRDLAARLASYGFFLEMM